MYTLVYGLINIFENTFQFSNTICVSASQSTFLSLGQPVNWSTEDKMGRGLIYVRMLELSFHEAVLHRIVPIRD
jgi:hypothetical protein